jgi:hypothetical protein
VGNLHYIFKYYFIIIETYVLYLMVIFLSYSVIYILREVNGYMKKIFGILVVTLFIATTVLPVVGTMNIVNDKDGEKTVNSDSLPVLVRGGNTLLMLPPWLLVFFNGDWNYWDKAPDLYTIPKGNVGIGTETPTEKLEVSGTVYSSSGGFKFPDGSVQTTAASGGGTGGDDDWKWSFGSGIDGSIYHSGLVGIGGVAGFEDLTVWGGIQCEHLRPIAANDLKIKTGTGATGLIVKEIGGNVGIKTDDPEEDLHVIGDGYIQGIFESTNDAAGIKLISSDNQAYELQSLNDGGFILYDRTDERYILYIDTDGNIDMFSNSVRNYQGFPRPDWDSGWQTIPADSSKGLDHHLGGNPDNYVVDIQRKSTTSNYRSIEGIGGDDDHWVEAVMWEKPQGFYWYSLSDSIIRVKNKYLAEDIMVRVRIWVYE